PIAAEYHSARLLRSGIRIWDSLWAIGECSPIMRLVADSTETARLTVWVHGYVQGVGFRWWARSKALELGLVGSASNLADGRVEVVAEGPREHCERLLTELNSGASPGRVDRVTKRWSTARGGLEGFVER